MEVGLYQRRRSASKLRSNNGRERANKRMCQAAMKRAHSIVEGFDDSVVPCHPMERVELVPGYESLSFDAVCIPPPDTAACEESIELAALPGTDFANYVHVQHEISEQQARAALLCHVTDHCCYGRSAARKMHISRINFSAAQHYELQTFTEKRKVSWTFAPYAGVEVEECDHTKAPQVWDIAAEPAEMFHDEVKVLEVPNTASIKYCHRCRGHGSLACAECHGKGWTRCLSCHGNGWSADSSGYRERCYYCQSSAYGDGRQDCLKCNAKGRVACAPCDSYGQVRYFIRLTISWKVNTSEYIDSQCELPEALVRNVSGQVVLEQQADSLSALTMYPVAGVLVASQRLIDDHKQKFSEQRVLQQRQQVRVVPVAEVSYCYRSQSSRFWVFGYENCVHAPDYPGRHCFGCCAIV